MRQLLLVFGLMALGAQAEIYKWVDEQGNVHFGDAQSARHVKETEEVEAKTQRNNYEINKESKAKQKKILDALSEERALKKEEQKQRKAESKKRKAKCEKKRKALADYKRSQILYDKNEDGSKRILSDSERAVEEQRLAAEIEKNCKNY